MTWPSILFKQWEILESQIFFETIMAPVRTRLVYVMGSFSLMSNVIQEFSCLKMVSIRGRSGKGVLSCTVLVICQ